MLPPNPRAPGPLLILSDGTGDTARKVLGAALRQFEDAGLGLEVRPHVNDAASLAQAFSEASDRQALVITTLVQEDMRGLATSLALHHKVRHIDLLGPLLGELGAFLDRVPVEVPNLLHRTDERYYRRIDAIEFTVHADDGRDPNRLAEADVVLVGPSRSGKTPLSTFLAHRGLKVANQPLMIDVPVPDALFDVDPRRVVGLVLDGDHLRRIRRSRMAALQVRDSRRYDDPALVEAELDLTASLCRDNGWRLVDVTNRAIEETAAIVIQHLELAGILGADGAVLPS